MWEGQAGATSSTTPTPTPTGEPTAEVWRSAQQGHELAEVMTFGPLSSSRDFTVEGVANPQQQESKGQGAEPVWSTHLSADSSISDGSTGSLEQQPDAGQSSSALFTCSGGNCCGTSCLLSALPVSDTDSLSQGSSAGSLEENHLGALASSGNQGSRPPEAAVCSPSARRHSCCLGDSREV